MPDVVNPVAYYSGDKITCFPSSNAKDFGKLHTEFNEARFVTRVAKKNFCTKNPSFVLSAETDLKTNTPVIQLSVGECSINGMDIIASIPIQIEPPAEKGKWYLAFKLVRDNLGRDFDIGKYKYRGNVLGDLVVGVTKTFEGMTLTYYDTRLDEGDEDADMLYLGYVYWDGNQFTEVVEDPQKYTRIEAEDVGCYIKDPKHADITYMNLQEWMYKVPDWYFSKEGDVCYGEINVVPGRGEYPSPYSDPMPGFQLRAYDDNTVRMVVKAPGEDNTTLMRYGDINNDGKIDAADIALLKSFLDGSATPTEEQKKLACVSGARDGELSELDVEMIQRYIDGERPEGKKGEKNPIGKTACIYGIGEITHGLEVYSTNEQTEMGLNQARMFSIYNDNIFHLHNDAGLCFEAEHGDIKIEADNDIIMKRFDPHGPVMKMTGNIVRITDPDTPDLKWEMNFYKDGAKQLVKNTFGQSEFQYNLANKWLTLLGTNTERFEIVPPFYMNNNTNRVLGTLYFGPENGNNNNYMKKNEIMLDGQDSDNINLKMTDRYIYLKDENGGSTNSYIMVGGNNDANHIRLNSNGNTEIKNTTGTAEIKFIGNNSNNVARIYHNTNDNYLRVDTNFYIKNDIVADGDAYINGGDLTVKKQGGEANINLSDGTNTYKLYHKNGEKILRMNTTLNMDNNNIENVNNIKAISLNIGTGNNKFTVDKDGNCVSVANITGAKVYGSVYNDVGEILRKPADLDIPYGTVVCIHEDGLIYPVQTENDLDRIIGITSDTMGMILGDANVPEEDEKVEVGMLGLIWTRTLDVNIKAGDMIKVNTDGTVSKTMNKSEKFATAMSSIEDGRVRIFYKG